MGRQGHFYGIPERCGTGDRIYDSLSVSARRYSSGLLSGRGARKSLPIQSSLNFATKYYCQLVKLILSCIALILLDSVRLHGSRLVGFSHAICKA